MQRLQEAAEAPSTVWRERSGVELSESRVQGRGHPRSPEPLTSVRKAMPGARRHPTSLIAFAKLVPASAMPTMPRMISNARVTVSQTPESPRIRPNGIHEANQHTMPIRSLAAGGEGAGSVVAAALVSVEAVTSITTNDAAFVTYTTGRVARSAIHGHKLTVTVAM